MISEEEADECGCCEGAGSDGGVRVWLSANKELDISEAEGIQHRVCPAFALSACP